MIENRATEYITEIEGFCFADDDENAEAVEPEQRENELIRPGYEEEEPTKNPYATAGYASVGSGAALVATGATFYFIASSQRNQVTGADSFDNGLNTSVNRREALEIESRANLFDSIALGSAITGGLLLGTGIYLLAADHDISSDSSFAFTWLPDFQGISWSTSF
jgi:hypothetical protein